MQLLSVLAALGCVLLYNCLRPDLRWRYCPRFFQRDHIPLRHREALLRHSVTSPKITGTGICAAGRGGRLACAVLAGVEAAAHKRNCAAQFYRNLQRQRFLSGAEAGGQGAAAAARTFQHARCSQKLNGAAARPRAAGRHARQNSCPLQRAARNLRCACYHRSAAKIYEPPSTQFQHVLCMRGAKSVWAAPCF